MISEFSQLLKDVATGDEEAARVLLQHFADGSISPEEQEQVHIYLRKVSTNHAIYFRAKTYEYGYGVRLDPVNAFLLMREAASRNHPRAIFEIGRYFLEGIGAEKNYDNAREWLLAAAGSPYYVADAMYYLGRLYEFGWGVDCDSTKAREWYVQAAKCGYVKL